MTELLNPASAKPPPRVLRKNADANMRRLRTEVGLKFKWYRYGLKGSLWAERDGRYKYRVEYNGKRFVVDMPGCTYRKIISKDVFTPRVLVDGSTWTFRFAASALRDLLLGLTE